MIEREIYWIAYYDTYKDRLKGYNLTPGGDGNINPSKETRNKISASNKGKLVGKNNPMYGKNLYDILIENHGEEIASEKINEWKNNISKGNKNKKRSEEHKRNYSKSKTGINNSNFGKKLSKETIEKRTKAWKENRNKKEIIPLAKEVLQYDKEGVFIKEWKSITMAMKELGIWRSNIIKCCKGKSKIAGGFIWKYKL